MIRIHLKTGSRRVAEANAGTQEQGRELALVYMWQIHMEHGDRAEEGLTRDRRQGANWCVCCFVLLTQCWGIVTVPGFPRVNRPQTTWGGRIFTLRLYYVAGYTGPFVFLFERTHNYPVDNQGLLPWRLRCLGESKVRSASLVRVSSGGKIPWVQWSQDLRNPPPPTTKSRYRPSNKLVCSTEFAGASFFIGLFFWKIRRKLRSRKGDDQVFPSCCTSFQH